MLATKDTFLKYESIRRTGDYNMIIDATKIMLALNINPDEYIDILQNYDKYANKYLS